MTRSSLLKLVKNENRINVNLLLDFRLRMIKLIIAQNQIGMPMLSDLPAKPDRQLTDETLRHTS